MNLFALGSPSVEAYLRESMGSPLGIPTESLRNPEKKSASGQLATDGRRVAGADFARACSP